MWNIIENESVIKMYLILQCLLYKSFNTCPHEITYSWKVSNPHKIQDNPIMRGKWCKNIIIPGDHGLKNPQQALSVSSRVVFLFTPSKCILKSAQHSGSELPWDLISSSYQIKDLVHFNRLIFSPVVAAGPRNLGQGLGQIIISSCL